MEAIKTLQRVKDQRVSIPLPNISEDTEVEVIVLVLPSQLPRKKDKKEAFLSVLRQGPTLSAEEIETIESVAQEFQQWTIQQF